MSSLSSGHRLPRKPRVHLTYDVETGGGIEKRELPFVLGVLGDFGGQAAQTKSLHERKFVSIDRDNFDTVMAGIKPAVRLRVPSAEGDGAEIPVELFFEKLDDFRPDKIAERVPHLKKLLDQRDKLVELLNILNDPKLAQQFEKMVDQWSDQIGGAR